jgi:hypothetical protein
MKVRFVRYESSRRRSASSSSPETRESTKGGFCPSSIRGILVVCTLFAMNLVLLTKTFQLAKLAVLYDVDDIDIAAIAVESQPRAVVKAPEYVPKLSHDPEFSSTNEEPPLIQPTTKSSTRKGSMFVDGFDVQRMLETNDTSVLAAGPYYEMHAFLSTHKDTPGGRFLALLEQELYGQPDWEPTRYRACYKETNLPLCLGGFHNIVNTMTGEDGDSTPADAAKTASTDIVTNLMGMTVMGRTSSLGGTTATASHLESESSVEKQRAMYLPLLPTSDFSSVYSLLRYQPPQYNGKTQTGTTKSVTSYLIAKLEEDVNMACIPLMLAAASIDPDNGMVVELSPFAGFSSKCLAYGVQVALMKSNTPSSMEGMTQRRQLTPASGTSPKQHGNIPKESKSTTSTTTGITVSSSSSSSKIQGRKYKRRGVTNLVSYGTFKGEKTAQAITKRAQWVKRAYPNLADPDSSDLGQLWRDTVKAVYWDAKTVEGYINRETLNTDRLVKDHGHPWQVLVIDNIQSSSQWHNRLAGLTMFSKGNILFWSDFLDRPEHIQMVYGCFRSTYLMPVYVSWNGKHMAFIVTRSFTSFQKTDIIQCYRKVFADKDRQTDIMKARLKQDVAFLAGLTMDSTVHEQYGRLIEKTTKHMLQMLDTDKSKNWNLKAALAGKIERNL